MITFLRELPAWVLSHPWTSAGIFSLAMVAFTSLILLNPEGRQVRDFFRRKR